MHRTLALGLLLTCAMLSGCKDTKLSDGQSKPVPVVLVQKVVFERRDTVLSYAATVKARIVSDQAFRVPGKVVKRLVNVGDVVAVGTPLAEIDTADLKLQLAQIAAEAQAAQQALDQQVIQTRRIETLAKDGWAARAALDQQHVVHDEAQARYDRATQSLALAQNAIDYAVLKSDSDGVVTDTAIEPGQVVAAGQKAISIARAGDLEALVAIPETGLAGLAAAEASFTLWNDPGKAYRAKLRELSPVADPATRTFAARFAIEASDDAFKLGMSGQVHINTKAEELANVPLSAIFDQGQGPGVWRVDKATGKIELKPVRVASMGQSMASLSGGVTEGQYIVALGAQKLDAGVTVRAVETLQP